MNLFPATSLLFKKGVSVFKKVFLVALFLFSLSFLVNLLFWFIVSKTMLVKDVNSLSFFRYFSTRSFTNFGYKTVLGLLFKDSPHKVSIMTRPYPPDVYLYRGKNYKGEYTYAVVGKYVLSYDQEEEGKENSLSRKKVIVIETSRGKKYGFWYNSGEEVYLSGVFSSDYSGLPESNVESQVLGQDGFPLKSGSIENNSESRKFTVLVPDFLKNSPDEIYSKGALVLVKFVSEKDLKDIRSDNGGIYKLFAAWTYGYDL